MTSKFSDATIQKAKDVLAVGLDAVKQDETYPNIWWVLSSSGAVSYRVQHDYNPERHSLTWITCTCPHGLNVGAGETSCYHAAAVLMMIQANRPNPNPELPEEVMSDGSDLRRVRQDAE